MHWLLLLCIPLLITLVAGLLVIALAVRRAPEGYQDADGFHARGAAAPERPAPSAPFLGAPTGRGGY